MEILPIFIWADTQMLECSIKKEKLNRVNYKKSFLNPSRKVNFYIKQEKTKKRGVVKNGKIR